MYTLRSSAMRGTKLATFARHSSRPFSIKTPMLAQGDYGGPHGDPAAEKPQEQGRNPKVDQEHPGPPPPSAAKSGKSSKNSSKDSSTPQQSSSGSKTGGAQPKIHNKPEPDKQTADVSKHNEEFEKRGSKQGGVDNEKVEPGFWKGHAGDEK